MGLPPLRTHNISTFTESDRKHLRYAQAGIGGVGMGPVTNLAAPIRCQANQIAIIDEVVMTAQLNDNATPPAVACTLHVNGATEGELGAPATVAAHQLKFHFPGIADASGVRRSGDRIVLRPQGNLIVRPSSTLWVQSNTAGAVGCSIKYRIKGIVDAYRDGDLRKGGKMPNVASTNSLVAGGTGAATSKAIVVTGTVLVSGGVADAGGTNTTMVDADRTEADDTWNGKKIRFTSGANNGLVRVITDFDATTDTTTFAPAAAGAVGAGDTYEFLDTDEAIEILGFYLTGHNFNAAADDIRLGFWDGAAGNFTANGSMVFRGWAMGASNVFQPRVLVDDTRGCIQGALGSDLYIQASANLAGATPTADYNVIYRKVNATEVASTSGTIGAVPTTRKKFWYYTQAAGGAAANPFFGALTAGADNPMISVHGHAFSCTNTDAANSIIGLTVGGVGAPLSEYTLVGGDGDGNAASTSGARTGLNALARMDLEPGFLAFDLVGAMTNRAQLAWGTFRAGSDGASRDTTIV